MWATRTYTLLLSLDGYIFIAGQGQVRLGKSTETVESVRSRFPYVIETKSASVVTLTRRSATLEREWFNSWEFAYRMDGNPGGRLFCYLLTLEVFESSC